jgi:phage tail protein X
MNRYIAADGERLDSIVFKAYGSVDPYVMEAVMEENEHLLASTVLNAGDPVYLPDVEIKQEESTTKALW